MKIEIIEEFGKMDKVPLEENTFYTLSSVKLNEFCFFKRTKYRRGEVSSVSYARTANSKKWQSSAYYLYKLFLTNK